MTNQCRFMQFNASAMYIALTSAAFLSLLSCGMLLAGCGQGGGSHVTKHRTEGPESRGTRDVISLLDE